MEGYNRKGRRTPFIGMRGLTYDRSFRVAGGPVTSWSGIIEMPLITPRLCLFGYGASRSGKVPTRATVSDEPL